jgi:hypothetical protein
MHVKRWCRTVVGNVLPLVCAVFWLTNAAALPAQEEREFEPPKPILIINVASAERALNELSTVFEMAGRPDINDVIAGFVGGPAGDLKGLDRTLPIGMMFFLDDSLPPRPAPVGYIPVDNLQDLIKTMELGPVTARKLDEGRYELSPRRGNPIHVSMQHGYAFIASGSGALVDRDLPDPRKVTGVLSSRFDLSISFQIRNFPPVIRDVFIAYFRTSGERELQQRDDESETAYRIRRANGMSMLKLTEQVLRDGEQITLGVEAAADGRQASIELLLDAKPESEFAEFLKNIAGQTTYFEPLFSERHPLSASVSWGTDSREQEALTGWIDALQAGLTRRLDEASEPAITRLTDSLRATIEQGHIDAFMHFIPQAGRKFVFLGGLKLAGAETFAEALRQVLADLDELERLESIELNVHEHQGVSVHRLTRREVPDEEHRIYGGKPDLYFGVGQGVLWFGAGREGVLDEMERAIDNLLAATPATRTGSAAPFQLIFRMLPWMELPPREGADPLRRELAEEALEGGDDAVRIEIRPTDTGGRIRFQFDDSFVRMLGLALAQAYDRTQL